MFLKQLNALKFELNTFHFLEVFNKKKPTKNHNLYLYKGPNIYIYFNCSIEKTAKVGKELS